MHDIDDRLKRYYQAQQLEPWKIEEIALSTEQLDEPHRSWWARVSRLRLTPFPVAAAFSLMIVVASLVTYQYVSQAERMTRMLQEAAMNHTTRLQLEFESSDVTSINQNMRQLSFDVSLPEELRYGFEVLGARYCTISGYLAAHLKLIDKTSDKQISLFMTRASDDLNRIGHTQKGIDGIDVKLWNESGLFYAKAQLAP